MLHLSLKSAEGGAKDKERRRREERGREENYYQPLPSLLIKSITSNMFLMTVKAGGN